MTDQDHALKFIGRILRKAAPRTTGRERLEHAATQGGRPHTEERMRAMQRGTNQGQGRDLRYHRPKVGGMREVPVGHDLTYGRGVG